jgi:hypothetical protein
VVVRIDQSGAAPAFEGRSLEVEISGEHGWLYADTTRDGHEGSRARVMVAGPQSVRDVSRWLADAAEIPVRHITRPVAGGEGTALI